MRIRNKFFVAAAVAAVSYGAWSFSTSDEADEGVEGAELLANHVWVDRVPEHERDLIGFFVPLRLEQGRVGAAGRASNWRQLADMFMWSVDGGELSLYFGQEEVRWKPHVKTWRCEGEAPEPFELCLRMWDGRHDVVMYSKDEWELDPGQAEEFATVDGSDASRAVDLVHRVIGRDTAIAEPDLEAFEPATHLPFE